MDRKILENYKIVTYQPKYKGKIYKKFLKFQKENKIEFHNFEITKFRKGSLMRKKLREIFDGFIDSDLVLIGIDTDKDEIMGIACYKKNVGFLSLDFVMKDSDYTLNSKMYDIFLEAQDIARKRLGISEIHGYVFKRKKIKKYFKFLEKFKVKILRENPRNTEIVFT